MSYTRYYRGVVAWASLVASVAAAQAATMSFTLAGESDRLLILHLTETLPTGTRFANKERLILEQWGDFPQLVEQGTAKLTLNLSGRKWEAWALDMAGERRYRVPMHFDGDVWHLTLSTGHS